MDKRFRMHLQKEKMILTIEKQFSMRPQEGMVKMKLMKKIYIYKDPKLETPAEFEIQVETDR